MALIRFCCCWNSLRKGTYASVFYTFVYFCLTLFMVGTYGVPDANQGSRGTETEDIAFSSVSEDPYVLLVLNSFTICLGVAGILSCFLVWFGLRQNQKIWLIPWIFVTACVTFIDVIYAVYLLTVSKEPLDPLTAIIYTTDFIIIFVNVYCIICVISQYQELKEGDGAQRSSLETQLSCGSNSNVGIRQGKLSSACRTNQSSVNDSDAKIINDAQIIGGRSDQIVITRLPQTHTNICSAATPSRNIGDGVPAYRQENIVPVIVATDTEIELHEISKLSGSPSNKRVTFFTEDQHSLKVAQTNDENSTTSATTATTPTSWEAS